MHFRRNSVAIPRVGQRQEANTAEVVAQEHILLHAHKARRRGRAEPAPETDERPVATFRNPVDQYTEH